MTTSQELHTFAAALQPFCTTNDWELVGLQAEGDLLRSQRLAACPYLYLTHLAEELVSGHVIPLAGGRNFFILVRTPFAASATLKIVTLRTYSLIGVRHRGLAINRDEREVLGAPVQRDFQALIAEATDVVVQAITASQAFIQPVTSGPFPIKNAELLAHRSVFCTGTIAGTVLPTTTGGQAEAEAVSPAQFYLF